MTDKPDAYMTKDLDNPFKSLFCPGDIDDHFLIVIPKIVWVGKIGKDLRSKKLDIPESILEAIKNDGKYLFNIGMQEGDGVSSTVRSDDRKKLLRIRNELLIQIENYYSKGD